MPKSVPNTLFCEQESDATTALVSMRSIGKRGEDRRSDHGNRSYSAPCRRYPMLPLPRQGKNTASHRNCARSAWHIRRRCAATLAIRTVPLVGYERGMCQVIPEDTAGLSLRLGPHGDGRESTTTVRTTKVQQLYSTPMTAQVAVLRPRKDERCPGQSPR